MIQEKTKSILSRIKLDIKTFPIYLLLICVLGYGILINYHGIYWDDWPFSWLTTQYGNEGLTRYLQDFRPLMGRMYLLSMPLLGTNPMVWHIIALVLRWATGLVVWWTLGLIWPDRRYENALISVLFTIFPGFSQQPISIIYSHIFVIMIIFFLSIGSMVSAVRRARVSLVIYLISILTSALAMFSLEYFVGLELLRPILLWHVINPSASKKERIIRVGKLWAPYLIVIAIYLPWRANVLGFNVYGPTLVNELVSRPLQQMFELIVTILTDFVTTGFIVWTKPFVILASIDIQTRTSQMLIILVLSSLLLTYIYFSLCRRNHDPTMERRPGKRSWLSNIYIGMLGVFVAGWPYWLASLPIGLEFPQDRFTLPIMFGSSMMLIGLFWWVIRRRNIRLALLSVLIGLSVGLHFQQSNEYRREWNYQRAFLWQFIWRVPELQDGTTLITSELPFAHTFDNSLTAAFNWIYASDNHSYNLSHILYYVPLRTGTGIPAFEPDEPITRAYPPGVFRGSTSEMLVFYYAPPACLRVFDGTIDTAYPLLPRDLKPAIPLSNVDLIITDPPSSQTLTTDMIAPEPDQNIWCYYFQRADLARQMGHWQEIVELADIAFSLDDSPNAAAERLPFIEGYARTGNWERALTLSLEAHQINRMLDRLICQTWSRIEQDTPLQHRNEKIINELRAELNCRSLDS